MALWRLPRPDFHRLVDTDFQDTPLALWPARSPSRLVTLSIESSDSLVASAAALDCYRVERTSSRAGVAPAEVQRLFTAHFIDNYRQNKIYGVGAR